MRYYEIADFMHEQGDITLLEKKIIYKLSKDYEGVRDLLDIYIKEPVKEQIHTSEFIRETCIEILFTWYTTCRDKHDKKRSK